MSNEIETLALAIVNGTAPEGTPDFGAAQKRAVELACAHFPVAFGLRNHEGTFRVNVRNSYVSRGRVVVYTDQLRNGEWCDFCKGTIGELTRNIVRNVRFYLLLSYSAKHATEWHPTEASGPFSVLSRGNFATEGDAHRWAEEKGIHPSTYRIKSFDEV